MAKVPPPPIPQFRWSFKGKPLKRTPPHFSPRFPERQKIVPFPLFSSFKPLISPTMINHKGQEISPWFFSQDPSSTILANECTPPLFSSFKHKCTRAGPGVFPITSYVTIRTFP